MKRSSYSGIALAVALGFGAATAARCGAQVAEAAADDFAAAGSAPGSSEATTVDDGAPAEITVEDGGTGPYQAVATEDATLPGMTIFRPKDLTAFGADEKLPILLWGNGACANTAQEHKNFLSEIASHGYVILAIGELADIDRRGGPGGGPRVMTKASQLTGALDWILAQNETAGSVFHGKIQADKVAAMGMSCGGLQAIEISADPRICTTVVCNSGVLPTPSPMAAMPGLSKDVLKTFHGSVLYIMGGPTDIAYKNAMDDFSRVEHVPIVMAKHDVGHGGTYGQPHGGEFTRVALAWVNWQLKGDEKSDEQFSDETSELRQDPKWRIELKNMPAT
jgi:dienelactone hydrolase